MTKINTHHIIIYKEREQADPLQFLMKMTIMAAIERDTTTTTTTKTMSIEKDEKLYVSDYEISSR